MRALSDSLEVLPYGRQRRHRLHVISCYVDFQAVRTLISDVAGKIRLTDVEFMFERLEVYRGRTPTEAAEELNKLVAWCDDRDVTFVWRALAVGALMHAKGYAVVQSAGRGGTELSGGVVCVSSGNATNPGLATKTAKPNVEMSYISSRKGDMREFLRLWRGLWKSAGDFGAALAKHDAISFRYGLLASGVFLHDWTRTLGSMLGMRYSLTEEGRAQISLAPGLRQFGFEVEQTTITRNPLVQSRNPEAAAIELPEQRNLPRDFTKRYTVDTMLGRFCPRSIWETVENAVGADDKFKRFHEKFVEATEPARLDVVLGLEATREEELVRLGFVHPDEERQARWRLKIDELRENEVKLRRAFIRFEAFDLPYDFAAREELVDLEDSLTDSIAAAQARGIVARKVEAARQKRDLSLLGLDADETDELVSYLRKVDA